MILGGLFVVLKFHTKRENMTMNMNEKPMMIFEHLQFGEIRVFIYKLTLPYQIS